MVNPWKKGEERGTHVSDSDSEKEEKNPEVQVKPLARRSTSVGYPEREEPEQSGRIEGYREVSLYTKFSSTWKRRIATHFTPARERAP